MKYVVILGDGMADYPVKKLDGKTPLMVAETPMMDMIAAKGRTGRLQTIEPDMPTGSAVANLSVLGENPRYTFQGRGVLEAASLGIPLKETDMAMRVNLVSVTDGKMRSHSAGHITDAEAGTLLQALKEHFKNWNMKLYQGLSYRHLLVVPDGNPDLHCFPPHDYVGKPMRELLVKAQDDAARETAEFLNKMIIESGEVLKNHPVNAARRKAGKLTADFLWPWSPGRKPKMKTLRERYGISGAAISAVDLIKGLAVYAGMDVISVQGATGLFDTNFEGKADAALAALDDHDFVYVHVEAADEAGHECNLDLKIKCIEDLDKRLIRRIWDGLKGTDAVIAVLPDHPTPVELGSHVRDPVPTAIYDPRKSPDSTLVFNEESVKNGALGLMKQHEFIESVLDIKST